MSDFLSVDFKTIVDRLQTLCDREKCVEEPDPALRLSQLSAFCITARKVSQYLSEYHVWKIKSSPNSSRDATIQKIAQNEGITPGTVRIHMKVSGPLVNGILCWFKACSMTPWAIVIILLVIIGMQSPKDNV